MKRAPVLKAPVLIVSLVIASSPGLAVAGEEINERIDFAEDGRIEVSNITGVVEVKTWSRSEVELTGDLGDGSELIFDHSGDQLTIKIESESGGWFNNPEDTDLYLSVPVGANLELSGVSSDLTIADSEGDFIVAETVSGDVEVSASSQRVELTSVSGDVTFRGTSLRTSVDTVSGDVDIDGVSGELEISLVSGDVFLQGGEFSLGRFESVSGTLELSLSVADGGRLSVESMSGDVILTLPEDQGGSFRVQTFSGDIRSEFGSPQREKNGPGTRLDHDTGSSDATIRVENFSGDVRLKSK